MTLAITIVLAILATYGVTEIITVSYIAKPFREFYREFVWEVVPKFFSKHMVRWYATEDEREEGIFTDEAETTYDGREVKGYDMIACSICAGFWVAMIVSLCMRVEWWALSVYGGAVFLNRQER